MNNTPKTLQVYKASAGSGKTYTLVEKYLDLLLKPSPRNPKQLYMPDGYRRILVATFTNKATTELRERIVKNLRHISEYGRDNIIREEETPAVRERRLEAEKSRAKKVLYEILLDYSSLRVQTIDSFFQEVVRSFVMELNNSSATAEVALDSDKAIEMTVDQLLIQQGGTTLEWLGKVLQARAEEGDSTDVRGAVIELAKQLLFKDQVAHLDPKIYTPERINDSITELREKAKRCYDSMEEAYDRLQQQLALQEDILHLSAYGFLNKLRNASLKGLIKEKSKNPAKPIYHNSVKVRGEGNLFIVASKNAKIPDCKALIERQESYRQLITHLDDALTRYAPEYQLAKLLLEHLSLLPILSQLKESLNQYQREQRIVLIEEINGLVSQIINGSEVPFIYEKVGGYIMHYMLDEFQDTNRTQWENFKVLLEEGLSKGMASYIVGDVKQSIYRWRGTDSTLLNSEVANDPDLSEYFHEHILKDNWRSSRYIVEFNNAFFDQIYNFNGHVLGEEEATEVNHLNKAIYEKGVTQTAIRQEKPGYVQIEQVIAEEEDLTSRLKKLLTKLQEEDGYRAGDIAFIVRKNDEASQVAEILNQLAMEDEEHSEYYAFLSDEALLINNSKIVKLITSLFQHVAFPNDTQKELYFRVACLNLGISASEEVEPLIAATTQGATIFETTNILISLLSSKYEQEEELYISAFLDLIHDFVESQPNTYLQFNYWWKKVGTQRKVTMGSDVSNKIEIITLHKAKGLEYPVVIIPFIDWDISRMSLTSNLELCAAEELPEGFLSDPLPYYIIPEAPTKEHLSSLIGEKYRRIHEANYLDNLNLLYVAFTRPEERLYIFTNGSRSNNKVSNILMDRLDLLSESLPLNYDDTMVRWSYGTDEKREADSHSSSLERATELHILKEPSSSILQRLHTEVAYEDEAIQRGVIMHEVMASTLIPAHFKVAIGKRGLSEEEQQSHIRHFDLCMANPLIAQWFTPEEGKHILTEHSIYIGKGNQHRRPDRLIIKGDEATVIDFKFGQETDLSAHRSQVRRYMQLLEEMGYKAKGYLWYWMGEPQIVEVI